MTNEVKQFIEDHIGLVDSENFEDLYVAAFDEGYDNLFVKELTDVFQKSGIDVSEDRETCLYILLEKICEEALMEGQQNLHLALRNQPNWFGYELAEVIEYLEQMAYNLNVSLIPIEHKYYDHVNYFIGEL